LEAACRPDCILASNTSTIDISLIGQKTSAADRLVGAHFFSPAHIMPLLEIVRTNRTSSQVHSLSLFASATSSLAAPSPKLKSVSLSSFCLYYLICKDLISHLISHSVVAGDS
jgi:hypothetical protein